MRYSQEIPLENKEQDLCKIPEYHFVCEGNIGIPRNRMPQLTLPVLIRFLDVLKSEGIPVTIESLSSSGLRPVQCDLLANKVFGMLKAVTVDGTFNPCLKPNVLVARDPKTRELWIIDGHHSAVACFLSGQEELIGAYVVELDPLTVLQKLAKCPGVTYQNLLGGKSSKSQNSSFSKRQEAHRKTKLPVLGNQSTQFFKQAGTQAAFLAVVFEMGKEIYQWVRKEKDKNTRLDSSKAKELFKVCSQSMKDIINLNKQLQDNWIAEQIENYQSELSERHAEHKKGKLSVKQLILFLRDIEYLKSYATIVTDKSLIQDKVQILKKMTGLTDENLMTIQNYFEMLLKNIRQFSLSDEEALLESYKEIASNAGYSEAQLLEIAEAYFMIKDLMNEEVKCRMSDLIQIDEHFKSLKPKLIKTEKNKKDIEDVNTSIRQLRSCTKVWRHDEEWIPFAQPTFFVPLKQSDINVENNSDFKSQCSIAN